MTYNKKKVLALELELQRLFGESSYRVERSACCGKFHGHYDYSIVFGSGRILYVGMDRSGYLKGLQEQLSQIRYFRTHQAENTEKVRAILREHDTPFCDYEVGLVPYNEGRDLFLYAVIILTKETGEKFVYRETGLHYLLVSEDKSWRTLEKCMDHLLEDCQGEMAYIHACTRENEKTVPRRTQPRKGGLAR